MEKLTTKNHVWTRHASEIDHQELCQSVLEHGFAVVRHPDNQVKDYVELSDAIGHQFVVQGTGAGQQRLVGGNSGRFTIDNIPGLFIETGPGHLHEAPLHGELYFHHQDPPQVLWGYCHVSTGAPGRLHLCDGVALFEHLPVDVQDFLKHNEIMYTRHHEAEVWPQIYHSHDLDEVRQYLQASGIEMDALPDGSIRTRFTCRPLWPHGERLSFVNNILPFGRRQYLTPEATRSRVCLANGELFPQDIWQQIWDAAWEIGEFWYWQQGDIIVVDNTRVMHGREQLSEEGREIFIRLSHARFLDEVAPRP